VGLITDRDICMAGVMTGRQLAHIAVEEVTSGKVFTCKPDEDVRAAMKTMQDNKVRRLPVVTADGALEGILSMNDIVLRADEPKDKKAPTISYSDVVETFKSICEHSLSTKAQAAAGG
jgi:signal-transduction protein with cAMP-binding, CBS, and nucleotidyltransferase domain